MGKKRVVLKDVSYVMILVGLNIEKIIEPVRIDANVTQKYKMIKQMGGKKQGLAKKLANSVSQLLKNGMKKLKIWKTWQLNIIKTLKVLKKQDRIL